jgi:K+-sensing histidine kinase KdpD
MSNVSHPLRRWSDRMLQEGPKPRRAALVGVAGVVVLALALSPFDDLLGRSTLGVLLVVPVVGAALIGGRWPAYLVAATASVAYSLRLPPVGSVRVAVAEDLAALIVFFGVAVVVSTLVAGRIDALTRLERDRALLLRSVSHDLRTPLATIRGAATELLDDHEHEPAVERRMLQMIDSEAQRLDRLVANLLSLSRIEANAMVTDLQSVDLSELARRAAERAGRLREHVRVKVEVGEDVPVIQGDHIQLDQLLSNLLENAVRHSPEHEVVDLRVVRVDGVVQLRVGDRGPGVTPEEANAIFLPFRSGSLAGSSGVGLAICRAITQAHGGTIVVDDHHGGGAEFVVELPLD